MVFKAQYELKVRLGLDLLISCDAKMDELCSFRNVVFLSLFETFWVE